MKVVYVYRNINEKKLWWVYVIDVVKTLVVLCYM